MCYQTGHTDAHAHSMSIFGLPHYLAVIPSPASHIHLVSERRNWPCVVRGEITYEMGPHIRGKTHINPNSAQKTVWESEETSTFGTWFSQIYLKLFPCSFHSSNSHYCHTHMLQKTTNYSCLYPQRQIWERLGPAQEVREGAHRGRSAPLVYAHTGYSLHAYTNRYAGMHTGQGGKEGRCNA